MHILFLIHSLRGGGAERVTATLGNHWSAKGWRVTVATLTPGERPAYPLGPGVRRVSLDLAGESGGLLETSWNTLRRVAALRRLTRRERPDVAVAMMSTASTLLAQAGPPPGGIAIGTERNFPPLDPLGHVRERVRSGSYARLDAVVAQTWACGDWITARTRARAVAVIANPVVFPLPEAEPLLRPADWLRQERKVVLASGRLVPQKGFDRLLQAFAAVRPDFPDWTLVLLGDGPLAGPLGEQARSLGIGDCVCFPGRVGNIGDWFARADLFALSSRHEGFPNVLCEAMAHGLPAVSVDCQAGPRDIIRDGIDGLLVAQDDPEALTLGLRRLMGDSALRHTLAARAVEIRERLSLPRIAGEWEDLFANLLRARRGGHDHAGAS